MEPSLSTRPVPVVVPLLLAEVPRRSFEGLFEHGLKAEGALADALRAAGYDPRSPMESHSFQVWRRALEVARVHCYGTLPVEQGYRRLGRHFVDGFAQTVVGRVLAAAAPLLGAERVLVRLPGYLRAARSDMDLTLEALAPGRWKVIVQDPDPLPDFVIGAIEQLLISTGVAARVSLAERRGSQYLLHVAWDPS